jgi:regulatory protein
MAGPRPAPAPLDEKRIEQAALDYLARFASSSESLRRVLLRRIARAAKSESDGPRPGAAFVDRLIARYVAAGLLDDRAYAAQQAASLHARGASAKAIAFRLKEKGVGAEHVRAALTGLAAAGASELASACALARRRRLGPCRPAASRAAFHRRDLGVLARAGFALDIARRVLAAPDPAALDRLAQEGEDED